MIIIIATDYHDDENVHDDDYTKFIPFLLNWEFKINFCAYYDYYYYFMILFDFVIYSKFAYSITQITCLVSYKSYIKGYFGYFEPHNCYVLRIYSTFYTFHWNFPFLESINRLILANMTKMAEIWYMPVLLTIYLPKNMDRSVSKCREQRLSTVYTLKTLL